MVSKEKTRYSIQQMSNRTGLSIHTLRYYEKEGIIKDVKRDQSGRRVFSDQDAGWIDFITCLKGTGMSIEAIKSFTTLVWEGDHTIDKRLEILHAHKKKVLDEIETLKKMAKRIDGKISWYEKEKSNGV